MNHHLDGLLITFSFMDKMRIGEFTLLNFQQLILSVATENFPTNSDKLFQLVKMATLT